MLLHEYGYDVTPTDVSAMRANVRASCSHAPIRVQRMDVREEGSTLGSFDVVASIQAVEHVEGSTLVKAIATPNTSLLIFRERFSTGWRISGAKVLWHGVADGRANAFLIQTAGRDLTIVYAPKPFLLLAAVSWFLQAVLMALALPIWRVHAR